MSPPTTTTELELDADRNLDAAEVRLVRGWFQMTQADFAHRLGVSKRTVEEWEAGRNPVPFLVRLALQMLSLRISDERQNRKYTTGRILLIAERVAQLPEELD